MGQILQIRFHVNRLFWQHTSLVQKGVAAVFIMVLLSVVMGIGLFSYYSFQFLYLTDGGGIELVLYALSIGLALIFLLFVASSFVTFVSLAYHAPDLAFFFSLPLHPSQIVGEKLVENVMLSAWGVLLLGLPVLLGMGLVVHAGLLFYLLSFVLLLIICSIASLIGSALAALTYRFLGRLPRALSRILAVVAVYGAVRLIGLIVLPDIHRIDVVVNSGQTFGLASISRPFVHLLPSYQATLLIGSVLGHGSSVAPLLWLLITVVAVLGICWYVVNLYYIKGWQMAEEFQVEASFISATSLFSSPSMLWEKREILQLVRDLRSGGQVAFIAILGGLSVLVLGLAHSVHEVPPQWQAFILAALVGVFGYVLATFALRFVFPSISLESQSSWLPWSSPVSLDRLIAAKWNVNLGLMVLGSGLLALLCLVLLPYDFSIRLFVAAHLLIMAAAIGSIHLGLGLTYPNFHESDPGILTTTGPGLAAVMISLVLVVLDAFMVSRDVTSILLSDWTPALLHGILWVGMTVVLITGWTKRSHEAAKTYTF